jgi:hypothetical protein
MIDKFMIVATVSALTLSATAFAQGTADQAKDMLTKATAAVKADKAKALDQFNNGTGGFLQGDLYVFCFNVGDAKLVALANPNAKQLIGTDVRDQKDSTGKEYGREIFVASTTKPEGEITVTDYLFPKPGADKTPVQKESFTTKVSDLVCGVGYYK